MQKIPVNAGFTCPNRDGTLDTEGCTYCNNAAFSPPVRESVPAGSVAEQVRRGIRRTRKRYPGLAGVLPYFQSYTNTYAPLSELRALFSEALGFPEVRGLCVGTRPDCVDAEKIDLLAGIAEQHFVSVEYGLQSSLDRTLERINRGHTSEDFRSAVRLTAHRGIRICAHVILFLPGESEADMLRTAEFLSALPVDSVKIHHLHAVENTRLAAEYRRGEVRFPGFEEYVRTLCTFLEHLRPDMIIERIVGDSPELLLVAPEWTGNKNRITHLLRQEFERRGTRQGGRTCLTSNC